MAGRHAATPDIAPRHATAARGSAWWYVGGVLAGVVVVAVVSVVIAAAAPKPATPPFPAGFLGSSAASACTGVSTDTLCEAFPFANCAMTAGRYLNDGCSMPTVTVFALYRRLGVSADAGADAAEPTGLLGPPCGAHATSDACVYARAAACRLAQLQASRVTAGSTAAERAFLASLVTPVRAAYHC